MKVKIILRIIVVAIEIASAIFCYVWIYVGHKMNQREEDYMQNIMDEEVTPRHN